jgi:hypothetical protein
VVMDIVVVLFSELEVRDEGLFAFIGTAVRLFVALAFFFTIVFLFFVVCAKDVNVVHRQMATSTINARFFIFFFFNIEFLQR